MVRLPVTCIHVADAATRFGFPSSQQPLVNQWHVAESATQMAHHWRSYGRMMAIIGPKPMMATATGDMTNMLMTTIHATPHPF